jgi:hypothetical protein
LAEHSSRRDAIGKVGRGLVVLGAATAGVAKLSPARAVCAGCNYKVGNCTITTGIGCGGGGRGNCTGDVRWNDDARCGATYGLNNGYWWFCCQNGSRYVCQDCCDNRGNYVLTIKRYQRAC